MASTLRLLLIVMLFWCGLHAAEPAWAHEEVQVAQTVTPDDVDQDREAPGEPAHVGHHHCPVEPTPCDAGADLRKPHAAPMIFTARATPLGSHAQAPPLQPPSA